MREAALRKSDYPSYSKGRYMLERLENFGAIKGETAIQAHIKKFKDRVFLKAGMQERKAEEACEQIREMLSALPRKNQ